MPDDLLERLRRFHDHTFPGVQEQFQTLVTDGQHPTILFIGCSDSRLMPYLLTGTGPGDLPSHRCGCYKAWNSNMRACLTHHVNTLSFMASGTSNGT